MTIQAVAWVLDYSRSRAIDRLVLLAMANHENEGFVGISKARLAHEAGDVSEASIRRSWKALQGIGELAAASETGAPSWWLDIDVRRRPRLWVMTAFLGRQSDTPRGTSLGTKGMGVTAMTPQCRPRTGRSDAPSGRFPGELEIWRAEGLQP